MKPRYPTHEMWPAMWYVGMDVHVRQTTFCVLDDNGRKVRTRTVRSGWRTVVAELKRPGHPFAVCYEASAGYAVLFGRLAKIARPVEVARPGYQRFIPTIRVVPARDGRNLAGRGGVAASRGEGDVRAERIEERAGSKGRLSVDRQGSRRWDMAR